MLQLKMKTTIISHLIYLILAAMGVRACVWRGPPIGTGGRERLPRRHDNQTTPSPLRPLH